MKTPELCDILFYGGHYPNLLFLLLTKRPSNINKYIPEEWKEDPPQNVMFGTSPCNQKTFDKLVPQLLKVKGKHFLSMEPQLSEINMNLGERWCFDDVADSHECNTKADWINWVIQGGESGAHKRPFNLQWAYSIRDQCEAMDVPYFFKQIDKVQAIPENLRVRQFPKV